MFGWLKRKRVNKSLPSWLLEYYALSFKVDAQLPLEEGQYAVLDCETTGLGKEAQVITIGAVGCTTKEIYLGQIIDQHYACKQVGSSSEIHGELSSIEGMDVKSGLEELVPFLSNRVIVGHNISFDVFKINQMLQEHFGCKLKNQVLDTANMEMRLDPVRFERTVGGNSNLHLDDLCDTYSIPIENRHTALGDAYLTAQLFQKLCARLATRGIKGLKQLISG